MFKLLQIPFLKFFCMTDGQTDRTAHLTPCIYTAWANNNYYYEDSASIATFRFSTLSTISGNLEGFVCHKNNRYQKL